MFKLDPESLSRLGYSMLQSCLHGVVTSFLIEKMQGGIHPVFHTYALLLFALWTFRFAPRIACEHSAIQERLRLQRLRFTAAFFLLQVSSWVAGYHLHVVRKGKPSITCPSAAHYVNGMNGVVGMGCLLVVLWDMCVALSR